MGGSITARDLFMLRLPHPFILLLGGVAVAAALTWILPAGNYERRPDPATGRNLVVPGTYARTEPTPVGPMAALLAVPRGIVAGADVVLTVLFVGGAFALLDATGALARLVGALVGRTRNPRMIVVLVCLRLRPWARSRTCRKKSSPSSPCSWCSAAAWGLERSLPSP